MEKQIVECEFTYWPLVNFYMCNIKNKLIQKDAELQIIGEHKEEKTNHNVVLINFENCSISKVPQGLTKIFPNLKILVIINSKLKSIVQKDLKEYRDLIDITVRANEIHFLPGDLFIGMKNLEQIWFDNNKIEVIESNLLDGLEKLKVVNFTNNRCIDKYYNSIEDEGNATLEEIKNEIREKYSTSPWKKLFILKHEHENGICGDLKRAIQSEKFKDFTVEVDDEEFRVHKLILVARSPVLSEMIENNIDAECLKLVDISKDIFREILNFMYTDELIHKDINYLHLFAAAGRLKIEKLKNFAAINLVDKVNTVNAIEILTLANKYESENLRQKSFKVIKSELEGEVAEIADDLAMKPEKLKKILDFKKEKKRIMREMEMKLEMQLKMILKGED